MKAVLDACVLFPTVLREILLGVAARGLYQPVWSDRILREWVRATAKLGPEAAMEAEAQATLARLAFPSAMQREQPNIEARLYLPDPNDIHVLAVAGGAGRSSTPALRVPIIRSCRSWQKAAISSRWSSIWMADPRLLVRLRRLVGSPDETRQRPRREM